MDWHQNQLLLFCSSRGEMVDDEGAAEAHRALTRGDSTIFSVVLLKYPLEGMFDRTDASDILSIRPPCHQSPSFPSPLPPGVPDDAAGCKNFASSMRPQA